MQTLQQQGLICPLLLFDPWSVMKNGRELPKRQLNEPKSDEIFNYIYVNIFILKLLPCLSQCSYGLSGLYSLNLSFSFNSSIQTVHHLGNFLYRDYTAELKRNPNTHTPPPPTSAQQKSLLFIFTSRPPPYAKPDIVNPYSGNLA